MPWNLAKDEPAVHAATRNPASGSLEKSTLLQLFERTPLIDKPLVQNYIHSRESMAIALAH